MKRTLSLLTVLFLGTSGCSDQPLAPEIELTPEPGDASFAVSATTGEVQVDLRTWTVESYADNAGSWNVSSDGTSVTQTVNGQPTLFYGDFDAFKTEVRGVIRVETNTDDDVIGFALGFQPGDATNEEADYLLVDWKKGDQFHNFVSPSCTDGTDGRKGLAVSRVFGIPTADEMWGHVNQDASCSDLNNGVEELARGNTLGSTGWVSYTDYTFSFQFTATLLRVYVNDVLELEVEGDFNNGRLAFYNFSQASVKYSAFTTAVFNNAPTAEDDAYEVLEDEILQVEVAKGVLANDTDADADGLTPVLVSGPEHGSLTLSADGSFTYTPAANFHGSDSFTYYASDGDLHSDPATAAVTVTSVNDPPVADAGDPYEADEGSSVEFNARGSFDVDGDALTYHWAFGDDNSGSGIDPIHTYADDGDYTVKLTVSDGTVSDAVEVSVTINNVDPSVGAITTPGTAAVGSEISVSADFTDPGVDDAHTATIFWGDGSDETEATVTESNGSGSVLGSHAYSGPGTYEITITVTDKDGGVGTSMREIVVETAGEIPIQDGDIAEMDRSIDGYVLEGSIQENGTAKSLKSLLKNSDAALQRGNTNAAKNTLGAFQKYVEAQSGKHIGAAAAEDLGTKARAKINKI